jgi:hypothetical protein
MSIRLEMLQVARVATELLGESTELVRDFLCGQQGADGGFLDRAGKSDLYYTVFGLDGLLALAPRPSKSSGPDQAGDLASVFQRVWPYLETFGDGADLDLVHLCCLARAWAAAAGFNSGSIPELDTSWRFDLLSRIEHFRSRNGGYNPVAASEFGTAYGCFLALSAYQDLCAEIPDPLGLLRCLQQLETADGAWTNERVSSSSVAPSAPASLGNLQSGIPHSRAAVGSTNATAAAVTVLRQLGQPVAAQVSQWLLARAHPQGGFLAVPGAPIPDLLSTATALHAIGGLQCSIDHLRESCLDFVDSLWTNSGAFYGHWQDECLDVEYTYYALLALGHLAL